VKKVSNHRKEYMRKYLKEYRKTYKCPKVEGACTGTNCNHIPSPGYKTCDSCRKRNVQYKGMKRRLNEIKKNKT
jgi:hypothetical protein